MKTLLALGVVTVGILAGERAEACGAAACWASWSAPGEAKSVPANAPALVFMQGTAPAGGKVTPAPPSLRNAAGPIASTRDGIFLRPSAGLPLGDVTLAWDETCTSPPPAGGVASKQLTFTVVAASPLPTALGSATLSYARAGVDVWTSSGSCTDKLDASIARFAFVLDPALEKFREVARFTTRVDGTDWGASAWGRAGPLATPAPYGGDLGAHRHDLVFAGCGPSPVGVSDRGVAPGKHSVEIRAEVAGAAAIPPAMFEIDLRCDGALPDGGTVSPDAAATVDGSPVDAPPVDAPPVDASPAGDGRVGDAAPIDDRDGMSGRGCAAGRVTEASLPFALVAVALATRRCRSGGSRAGNAAIASVNSAPNDRFSDRRRPAVCDQNLG